jgi:regulator of sigma E protease
VVNFLFAVVAFGVVNWSVGISRGVKIVEVVDESPAFASGIEVNDRVVSFNGRQMEETGKFSQWIWESRGEEIVLGIERDGEVIEKKVIARGEEEAERGLLGVVYSPGEVYQPPLFVRPFVYLYRGLVDTISLSRQMVVGFVYIFGSLFKGKVPSGVAGPVGIAALVSEAAKMGILPLLEFVGLISVNLAILNIIPFPPLDGFRILLLGVERIWGRRLVPRVEQYMQIGGMVILLTLMLLLTLSEIPKIISAGGFEGFVESIL